MDHGLKNVYFSPFRDRLEEIASRELAAVSQSLGFNELLRTLNNLRLVKNDSMHLGIGLENSCNQQAMSSAHINYL